MVAIKRVIFLFLLILVGTYGCSSIQEVKKDNILELVKQRQNTMEAELTQMPTIVQVPIKALPSEVKDVCYFDEVIEVEFLKSDIYTILSALMKNLNLSIVFNDLPVSKQQEGSQAQQLKLLEKGSEVLTLKYKGPIRNLFKILSEKTGYFFTCDSDKTVLVEKSRVFSIGIPNYPELLKNIKDGLEKLGATSVAYDNLTSLITFTADYNSYLRIRSFLNSLFQNASLVNLKIVLISVSYNSEQNVGIDWSKLGFGWQSGKSAITVEQTTTSTTGSPVTGVTQTGQTQTGTTAQETFKTGWSIVTNETGGLLLIDGKKFSFSGFLNFLEKYGKYTVLQNVYVQTLSGMKGKIEVAKEVPYIKEISLSTTGTSATTIGTAKSDVAKSGVEMEINPYYEKTTGILSMGLKINVSEVLRLVTLSAGQQIGTLTQPETSVKQVNTYIRMTPEQILILGGLIYEKDFGLTQGLPVVDTLLTKNLNKGKNKEELVILVKPTIIEFVEKQ